MLLRSVAVSWPVISSSYRSEVRNASKVYPIILQLCHTRSISFTKGRYDERAPSIELPEQQSPAESKSPVESKIRRKPPGRPPKQQTIDAARLAEKPTQDKAAKDSLREARDSTVRSFVRASMLVEDGKMLVCADLPILAKNADMALSRIGYPRP